MEIQVWILGGVNALLITVLILTGKSIASSLRKKLDAIINNLSKLNETSASQGERIRSLFTFGSYFRGELDKQDKRIQYLERQNLKNQRNGNIQ